jgi:hypothetical protein
VWIGGEDEGGCPGRHGCKPREDWGGNMEGDGDGELEDGDRAKVRAEISRTKRVVTSASGGKST